MSNRHLVAYVLIALILVSPVVFLLVKRWVRKRALKASNKPVYVKN